MMVKEIDIGSGVLGISSVNDLSVENKAVENTVKIEYYRGKDINITVPECIDGAAVTEIGKKAFLGAKTVTRIELPSKVSSIGDWAFASCSVLKEIVLPKRKLILGSGLFKDCVKLEKITANDIGEDISCLLALAVTKMDAPFLFDLEKAGSEDWIEHFDSLIIQILAKDDTDGFSKMLLCGEEDYVGDDSNLDTYILLRKKEKVRILLTRLMHKCGLSTENENTFKAYLTENMNSVVWPLVLEEHGEEQEYFDLLIDAGCINKDNVTGLIDSMGDRYTQMKGYLIRYKGESTSAGDFFDDLDL
ncbi:MAG: leucine-rich repeat domain-containing protein [Lachnospiraceae bacterium]|nr:leucine-rich repeat domain-containing protein [Lachnospiraceae bacterium]